MTGTALIMGGASGIGAAAALDLADAGYTVAVADLLEEAASEVASGLVAGDHCGFAVDVAIEASVQSCFEQAEGRLGPIRVLVVTAGIAGLIDGKRPSIDDTTAESWGHVFDVNARGTFLAIREMLRRRRAMPVPQGRIVTVCSIAAQTTPGNAPIAYAASKGAVLAMTRVAAVEAVAAGMTANAVAPGAIDTPMLRAAFPEGRASSEIWAVVGKAGEPRDVARAITFLASERSGFINGACLDVNGGVVMR